jgi:hypothetical protein
MIDPNRVVVARQEIKEDKLAVGAALGFAIDLVIAQQLDRRASDGVMFAADHEPNQVPHRLLAWTQLEKLGRGPSDPAG